VIRASYMAGLQAGNPTKLPFSGKITISRRLVLPGTVLSRLSSYEMLSQVILLPLQARYIHALDAWRLASDPRRTSSLVKSI